MYMCTYTVHSTLKYTKVTKHSSVLICISYFVNCCQLSVISSHIHVHVGLASFPGLHERGGGGGGREKEGSPGTLCLYMRVNFPTYWEFRAMNG